MSVIEPVEKTFTPTLDENWDNWRKKHPQRSIKDILQELRGVISEYEQKYKMKTEEFLPRYASGEFEMNDSYADYELAHWQGSYAAYQRLSQTEK